MPLWRTAMRLDHQLRRKRAHQHRAGEDPDEQDCLGGHAVGGGLRMVRELVVVDSGRCRYRDPARNRSRKAFLPESEKGLFEKNRTCAEARGLPEVIRRTAPPRSSGRVPRPHDHRQGLRWPATARVSSSVMVARPASCAWIGAEKTRCRRARRNPLKRVNSRPKEEDESKWLKRSGQDRWRWVPSWKYQR